MKYIVVTKNAKIVVNEEQRERFLSNFQNSRSQLIPLKGQLVDRFGIEIYEFDFFLRQEADKLKQKGLKRCRECAQILNRLDKCACFDNLRLRESNIFQVDERKINNLLT